MFHNHWLNEQRERDVAKTWCEYAMQQFGINDPILVQWLKIPKNAMKLKDLRDKLLQELKRSQL